MYVRRLSTYVEYRIVCTYIPIIIIKGDCLSVIQSVSPLEKTRHKKMCTGLRRIFTPEARRASIAEVSTVPYIPLGRYSTVLHAAVPVKDVPTGTYGRR